MNLLVNGLVTGAVFAIAACGLVVTYSTSGIFNFAHGALGMFCAYAYWTLRYDQHWPAPLALAMVLLVIAPLLGAALYQVVIRGLGDASEVVKLVVPISVLLATISLANWIWKPDRPHTIQPFFGADHQVTLFGVVLLWHDLTVVAVAIGLAIGLRLLLYRTRTGVAMRAVVDDRSLVELTGGRPDRTSLVSWMLGVSLSALAGILITPFGGGSLSTTLLTLLVINAFAAAMFGRLRNLPLTFVGAIVLGLATRMAFEKPTGLMPTSFDWRGNLRVAVPMIMLFVVLLVLPQDRLRGAVQLRHRERFAMPTGRDAVVAAGAFLVIVFGLTRILEPSPLIMVGTALAMATIACSLVLLVGYAGEVSLATMALAGIGGVVLFHHVGHDPESRAGLLAYLIAMAVCAVVGAAMALPALRLRGLYLALATAAFSLGVEQMVFKEFGVGRRIYPATLVVLVGLGALATWTAVRSRGLRTGAAVLAGSAAVAALAAGNGWLQREQWSPIFPNGSLSVPRPELFGIDFTPQANFVLLLAGVFTVVALGLVALRRSAYGRRLTAMKNSPAASATLGMDIVRMKLSVFMLSAGIAGLGGALFAQQLGSVTADRFSLFESMSLLMLLVVAGAGYVSGGLAAGLLYGVTFVVLSSVLTTLGEELPAFDGPLHWLAQFTAVLPALIGIGLGRNPSGFLEGIFVQWRPLVRHVKPVFLAAVAVEVALWGLAVRDDITGWTFALATAALATAAPRVAAMLKPAAFGRVVPGPPAAEADAVPLELVGILRPFSDSDRRQMDRVLDVGAGR
ncbi:hypothetical protein BH10ACT1_BH10ACT1_05970 [soil metagenome]